jgi:sortase A
MHCRRIESSGNRLRRLLRWTERLLVIAGVATLSICAVFVVDAHIAQRSARQFLESVQPTPATVRPPTPFTDAALPDTSHMPEGSAVAALSIPRVHLSTIVLHGSGSRTLRRGPGHLEHTALPGESGNMVVAGHRDSFFRPLRDVRVGDVVFLDSPQGTFEYRVTSLRVVKPADLSVLDPTEGPVLTLITCYPFWVFGNAPDRFVVRAVRVSDAPDAPTVASPAPASPPIAASIREEPSFEDPIVAIRPRPLDDDAAIREAVERYRLTYNWRLISRNDNGALAIFDRCDVSIASNEATAICQPSSRTFIFQRTPGGWAIKSIAAE